MKTNIKEYMELSAYNRAIDHLKDRSIGATLREDKKLVVEQVDYERAVKQIRQASKKDIEKVSLHIFENFLRKL